MINEAFWDAAAIYRENRDLLLSNGYVSKGAAGGMVKSPHHRIMRDAVTSMAELSAAYSERDVLVI